MRARAWLCRRELVLEKLIRKACTLGRKGWVNGSTLKHVMGLFQLNVFFVCVSRVVLLRS